MINQNNFYNLCYKILSHALNIPKVAGTFNDIQEGLSYRNNFPQTQIDFLLRKNEINLYIRKVRINNILDSFNDGQPALALTNVSIGKILENSNSYELYETLNVEINGQIINGMYQLIKHYFPNISDREIVNDLELNNATVLQKYGLLDREYTKWNPTQLKKYIIS